MVLVQEDDSHDEHVIYYLSRSLMTTEAKYLHVEKLALAAVQVVQCFRHYILLRKTTVISDCNPMQHILTCQLLGGKYSKWIVILQEFDLEFERAKSKKYLVFSELICDLPSTETENVAEDSLPDESLFLISSDDAWYGDIIIYLQTQTFGPTSLVQTVVAYGIKPVNTSFSVTLSIAVVLTLFFDVVSPSMRLRNI
jgi:hypothetical protein